MGWEIKEKTWATHSKENRQATHKKENGRAMHRKENGRATHRKENGRVMHRKNGMTMHRKENGRAVHRYQHHHHYCLTLSHSKPHPELYAALTEAFLDKPLVYDPQKGMVFDPPISSEYTTHVSTFKHSGRMINTTVPDGNCLFRSLSKALLGTERYHYRIRTRLLGFVYSNSNIFMSHIQQRCQSDVEVREYCLSMDRNGIWGTENRDTCCCYSATSTYLHIHTDKLKFLSLVEIPPFVSCALS